MLTYRHHHDTFNLLCKIRRVRPSRPTRGKTPKMGDPAINNVGEIEPNTHAFVVKVWREEGATLARSAVWRGHITHVASGQRRYITRLSEMDSFVGRYLQALHVRLPLFWRIYQWLNR